MYVNGKMISVETIPGMGRRGIKENGGEVNPRMIYLLYKNFCKCHNVPSLTTIKKRNCATFC
jgi:predicted metallopeptidase